MTDKNPPPLNAMQRMFFRAFARAAPEIAERLIDFAMGVVWNDKPEVKAGQLPQWTDLPEQEREAARQLLRDHMSGGGQ